MASRRSTTRKVFRISPVLDTAVGSTQEAVSKSPCQRGHPSAVFREDPAEVNPAFILGVEMKISIKERFWAKVKSGPECWVWRNFNGKYPYFTLRGRRIAAHRVAWEMGHGSIPKGMCVCHSCDNGKCVRPSHLFLGTQADNMADKVHKGRQVAGVSRGVHNGRAKLTEVQVRAIRCDPRTHRVISKDYEVHRTTIGCIKRNKTWTHVI
jgi:hypothetical protein